MKLRTLPCAVAISGCMLFFGGCHKPADPKTEAKLFFDRVFAGKLQEAYDGASFQFQAGQTEKLFETSAGELGLKGGKSVDLSEPSKPDQSDKTVVMDAKVTVADGKSLPFVVTMVKDGSTWRLYSLKSPRSLETGLSENRFSLVGKTTSFEDATARSVPDDKTIKKLIREALSQFRDAIRNGSFAEFYDYVADAWQSQLTEKQLQRAFQGFIDQGVDLSPINNLEPVLDAPPVITSEGLLVVTGHYPTKPYQVVFNLKFLYELPNWKLFGIDVTLRQGS